MPLKSIRILVICAGCVIGFVLLALFPSYRVISSMDRQIETLKKDVREQTVLHPLFNELLNDAREESPSRLPFPKKAKLPRSETGGISQFFQKLAQSNDFEVINVVPDVASLKEDSGILKLDTVIRGQFPDLRRLLLHMKEIPYLDHIETIDIRNADDVKEIRIKFWIAQE